MNPYMKLVQDMRELRERDPKDMHALVLKALESVEREPVQHHASVGSTIHHIIRAAMQRVSMSRLTKEQIAERLVKSADRLFSARTELREDEDVLQSAYDDASGIHTKDMYGDETVKKTRDSIRELDRQIGVTARDMEHLARELKKKK